MKKQMCNQVYLTTKELDILSYVYSQGGFAVETCPKTLGQNKNFYNRVRKLEDNGFVIVHRFDGYASQFDITQAGRDYINENRPQIGRMEKENDVDFLISLVKSSSLSTNLKDKVVEVLS